MLKDLTRYYRTSGIAAEDFRVEVDSRPVLKFEMAASEGTGQSVSG